MRAVPTSLRRIAYNGTLRSFTSRSANNRGTLLSLTTSSKRIGFYHQSSTAVIDNVRSAKNPIRYHSTAAIDDTEDELTDNVHNSVAMQFPNQHGFVNPQAGHVAAAEIRAANINGSSNSSAHVTDFENEPWRINLGRGNDNAWLMQPRIDSEWFTGVSPGSQMCPGKVVFLQSDRILFVRVSK